MRPVLCVDVGSTFTKAVLADADSGELLATAASRTTLPEVLDGVRAVRDDVQVAAGPRLGARAAEVGNGPDGLLVYLRPCDLANAPIDVRAYRNANETFPQESTLQEWFSESRFESYRHLGFTEMSAFGAPGAALSLEQLFAAVRTAAVMRRPASVEAPSTAAQVVNSPVIG